MEIIIDGLLATHGAWFKPYEKICRELNDAAGWESVVDVRNVLVDGPGNPLEEYQALIDTVVNNVQQRTPTVIVCTVGKSRSNAIAAGAVARLYGIGIERAIALVRQRTGFTARIHSAHLTALRMLYG